MINISVGDLVSTTYHFRPWNSEFTNHVYVQTNDTGIVVKRKRYYDSWVILFAQAGICVISHTEIEVKCVKL